MSLASDSIDSPRQVVLCSISYVSNMAAYNAADDRESSKMYVFIGLVPKGNLFAWRLSTFHKLPKPQLPTLLPELPNINW
eukprot:scaffold75382_cov34-Tisochrysis_lutea.AAC.2